MPQFLPSELPVRATTRQHWIVLFRRVHRRTAIAFAVLLVLALLWPDPWLLPLIVAVVALAGWRYLLWRNECIYLTSRRIVRMEGIPAVTRHEAWLRVDRITGAQFTEGWPGTWLDYATIDLEAPGDHPGVRHLLRVGRASPFYLAMRDTVFGEPWSPDPDDDSPYGVPTDYVTEPLPRVPQGDGHERRSRRGR